LHSPLGVLARRGSFAAPVDAVLRGVMLPTSTFLTRISKLASVRRTIPIEASSRGAWETKPASSDGRLSRRALLGGLGAAATLGGCAPRFAPPVETPAPRPRGGDLRSVDPRYVEMYGPAAGEPYPLPEVDLTEIEPRFLRRIVPFYGSEPPGTVIVDTQQRYLFLVLENGSALRYGVGVGREEAFNFQGSAVIGRKAAWPSWTPTPDMIRREPERYAPYSRGMPGGPDNPLGARALYLYRAGRDTFYRLHGTTDPSTIGTMVSSGCVRLLNQDIIDLYNRVPVGAHVIVRNAPNAQGRRDAGARQATREGPAAPALPPADDFDEATVIPFEATGAPPLD
jgi:lipoprotein-anchoring transpeptidase ErfK/SrfK